MGVFLRFSYRTLFDGSDWQRTTSSLNANQPTVNINQPQQDSPEAAALVFPWTYQLELWKRICPANKIKQTRFQNCGQRVWNCFLLVLLTFWGDLTDATHCHTETLNVEKEIYRTHSNLLWSSLASTVDASSCKYHALTRTAIKQCEAHHCSSIP